MATLAADGVMRLWDLSDYQTVDESHGSSAGRSLHFSKGIVLLALRFLSRSVYSLKLDLLVLCYFVSQMALKFLSVSRTGVSAGIPWLTVSKPGIFRQLIAEQLRA